MDANINYFKMAKSNYKLPFTPDELPSGKYFGALPDEIVIRGEQWTVRKTGDVDGVTYDRIKNMGTGQEKVLKRETLIKFLQKS